MHSSSLNRAAAEAVHAASAPMPVLVLPTALAVMASLDRSVSEIHMLGLVMLVALAWFGFRTERIRFIRIQPTSWWKGRIMKNQDLRKPDRAGFLLSRFVMLITAFASLATAYAVLRVFCPGFEWLAVATPAIVMIVYHCCLYDSWR